MHTFLKKAASLILCLAFLGNFPSALAAEPAAVPQTAVVSSARQFRSSGRADLAKLSQQEITQLLFQAPGHYDGPLFDQTPSCQAPYSAGMVTSAALQAATARLNALRRIAGLSAVTLDAGLCSSAQYGAVIQAARGSLSHTPAAPGSYDFISWPASGNFPTQLMQQRTAWSISLNHERFQTPSGDVRITITREADRKTWALYTGCKDGLFSVTPSGYGPDSCISFRPGDGCTDPGTYTVQVSGLKTTDGRTVTDFSYQVILFDLNHPAACS